jgi:general secretion pathway protein D
VRRKRSIFLLVISAFVSCASLAQHGSETEWKPQPVIRAVPLTTPLLRSMHIEGGPAELLVDAFGMYGIRVIFATPFEDAKPHRVDLEDADLATTGQVLGAMTHCFFVPVSTHTILAVTDDKQHRAQYEHLVTATFDVPDLENLSTEERTSIETLLVSLFNVSKVAVHRDSVTVHATPEVLLEVQSMLATLYRPTPQVLLQIKSYIVSRTHNRNLGVELPQTIKIFNVLTEANSLISSNSSVVQELISAGLVASGDTLGIAELLIAAGYASDSVLGSSSLYFGGGLTATGVQFDSISANASLSVSSVQQLESATLHLANDQPGTFKVGEHYPVLTATTLAVGASTSATSSSATPSIEYEDLGLLLEAKPHIVSDKEVLLHLHETIRSLQGSSLNTIPILDNQEFSSDLSVAAGVTTVVVSNLTRTEALATQGVIDSITTNSSRDTNDSELVITITPIITRSPSP